MSERPTTRLRELLAGRPFPLCDTRSLPRALPSTGPHPRLRPASATHRARPLSLPVSLYR